MTRLPTHKQRKFADHYLLGNTLKASVKKGYPNAKEKSTEVMGSKLIRTPHIQKYMQQVLNKAGLNDSYLADRLQRIIDAGTDDKALKEVRASDSLQGIKMAWQLRDRFPAQKQTIEKKELKLELKDKSLNQLNEMLKQNIKDAKRFTRMLEQNSKE